MTSLIQTTAALPFRAISKARHARAFHPQGFLCRGTWHIDRTSALTPDAKVLKAGTRLPCLVRVSRGAGLPESIGDFFGIAVRLQDAYGPDRHHDLLINSSADLPLLHHLFLPAPRWFAQSYSTVLPYRAGAGHFVIGLLPPDEEGPGPSLDAMRATVAAERATFGVGVAAPLGTWEPIGSLKLHDVLGPERGDVDFDPTIDGGGLVPATFLNRWRREAYRQSRKGRGAPEQPRLEPAPAPLPTP